MGEVGGGSVSSKDIKQGHTYAGLNGPPRRVIEISDPDGSYYSKRVAWASGDGENRYCFMSSFAKWAESDVTP